MDKRDNRITRTSGMTAWRARCGESRTSGSEGGPQKPADRKDGQALRSDPYTHFPRAARVAYAILDAVTRKWLATHLTAEETATQVEAVFTQALDTEGLWPAVEAHQAQRARHRDDSDEEPILLAMSDNGPQMRAGTTREFPALCCIAARFGRPGTPTDQAWIETLFGHIKTEWPHLEKITDPNTLRAELDITRHDYNTRRLHASLGYVTPDDEHQQRAERIRQARQDGLNRARLTRIAHHRNNKPNQP